MVKKNRESNIEMLRILCTLLIISSHFLGIGHISQKDSCFYLMVNTMMSDLSRVACTVFIIISAWFSLDKSTNISKVFHVWLTTIMYMVPLTIIGHHYNLFAEDMYVVKCSFLPVSYGYGAAWFTSVYIVLMLISPLLNYILQNVQRNIMKFYLFTYFCAFSLFATIFHENGKYALELVAFSFVYLLTGYIKKYKVVNERFLSTKYACIMFMCSWLFISALMTMGTYFSGNVFYDEMFKFGNFYYGYFQTIPNLICAFSLFFIFLNFKIRNRQIINKLASLSFGIIIFHNVPGWNEFFYSSLLSCTWHARHLKDIKLLIYAGVGILVIYIVGCVVEILRKSVCNLLIENRKWYRDICYYINMCYSGEVEIDYLTGSVIALVLVVYLLTIYSVFWNLENGSVMATVLSTFLGSVFLVISVVILYRRTSKMVSVIVK